ncbi:hypothetical protein INN71_01120 [Nocardioides sp. ChNu-153]|uniref:hypothetical protein n=1 Tax=unclassified Nocardioides TaxID=2615069 RepID=UPI0024076B2A|nr:MULTISPECIES: hypothetical protein [unclassified Nocardioides]MDF9716018.1 hypothetical protein [Nocardioides sp. ChNu-99]MDN7119986.1 hypothetical protein [Nocardioides sp. ChNu-153]
MSGVVAVDPGALHHHANRLAALAAEPRAAGGAARAVAAPGNAFGLLCGFIGQRLEPFGLMGAVACEAVGGALEATAEGLRLFGDDVVTTDATVGAAADRVVDGVEAVVPVLWETVVGVVTDAGAGRGGELARWAERLGATPVGGAVR